MQTFNRMVEERFKAGAIRVLRQSIDAAAPPRASPEGLLGWLMGTVVVLFSRRAPTIGTVTGFAFPNVRVSDAALGLRFTRAGLQPPYRYTMALRVAAIGALFGQGADVRAVETVMWLSAQQSIYRWITAAERRRRTAARTASILAAMRAEDPDFAFKRYVTPMLPGTRKWLITLTRSRTP